MRSWTVLRYALVLPLLGAACVPEPTPTSFYAPVQAALLDTRAMKGGTAHFVRITITNHQDRAMWYLVPDSTRITLPERGTFILAEKSSAEAIERGGAIEVRVKGSDFRAFRLPPQGKLTIARHRIDAPTTATDAPPAAIDVMEARDLYANGKPIEQLLGGDVLCGKDVKDVDTTDNTAKVRANSGTEPITTLWAEEHRFWMPKMEK